MIKRLQVENLNNKIDCDLQFNPDFNILTGKNGSGKTTILKLIWYLISGNMERIFREMSFNSIHIETSNIDLFISKKTKGEARRKNSIYHAKGSIDGELIDKEFPVIPEEINAYVESLNRRIAPATGSSLFFPTFRRVEGGFSTSLNANNRRFIGAGEPSLEEIMRVFSDRISVQKHNFVSSISTQDIVRLITERYAGVSETTNNLHATLSANIIERISMYSLLRGDVSFASSPDAVLKDIEFQVAQVSIKREELLSPFSLLSRIINQVFQKSIKITDGVVLGDNANAISSDKLSAGEKQMLSFFCYNAFYNNSPIFIDEPELSLHTDWQRILFPNLLKQDTGNQFIIATHSPFIYSKYPEKELVLNQDRGE